MIGSKPQDRAGGGATDSRTGIDEIAERLDGLLRTVAEVPRLETPETLNDAAIKAARRAWQARRERERIFGPSLVADPAWDILLTLFLGHADRREVTVFSVCSATAVAEWTVLRWITNLVEAKLVTRQSGGRDARSISLMLTKRGMSLMCEYFIRLADLDGAGA